MLAVLLVVPAAVGAVGAGVDADVTAEVQPEPRGSILIEGDDEFTRENGVRGGSGAVDDPYVISNWTIVDTAGVGIWLKDTRAHVVIEDVWVPSTSLATLAELPCKQLVEFVHTCGGREGVVLQNAANVSVQRVLVGEPRVGFRIESAADLHLEDVKVRNPSFGGFDIDGSQDLRMDRVEIGRRGNVTQTGERNAFMLSRTQNVSVSNLTIASGQEVGTFHDVRHVRFTDSHLGGIGADSDLHLQGGQNLTFVRSEMRKMQLWVTEPVAGLSLDYSKVSNHSRSHGLRATGASLEGLGICGSTFSDLAEAAALPLVSNVTIQGSLFQDNEDGLRIDGPDVVFERNRVVNSTSESTTEGVQVDSRGAQVRYNHFEANEWMALVVFGEGTNATHNWWDDPDGPQVEPDQPEKGQNLSIHAENVSYDPWSNSPPETGPEAVDCGVPPGEPGAKRGPDLPIAAHASVSVDVAGSEEAGSS